MRDKRLGATPAPSVQGSGEVGITTSEQNQLVTDACNYLEWRDALALDKDDLCSRLALQLVTQPKASSQTSCQLVVNQAELVEAAKAVVERWDSPNWKDLPHTGNFINRLRKAIAVQPKASAPSAVAVELENAHYGVTQSFVGKPCKTCGEKVSVYSQTRGEEFFATALREAEQQAWQAALKHAEMQLAMRGSDEWIQEAIEVVRYDKPHNAAPETVVEGV